MIRREPFAQTLVGSWSLPGRSADAQPAALELRGERPLLVPGLGRSIAVSGHFDAKGLATRRPLEGRVTFERWTPMAALYDLALCLDDGTACRIHGQRKADLAGFVAAVSTVRARVVDAAGRCLGELELRFDYRRDLMRYLT